MMRHLLDKLRRHPEQGGNGNGDSQEPSIAEEIEHFRQQQRVVAAKLMNGQHVYDELDRAAQALAAEVRRGRPQKA